MFLLGLMALLGAAGPGVRVGPAAAPLLVLAPGLCYVKLGLAGLALTSCARLTSSLQETGTVPSLTRHPSICMGLRCRGENVLCVFLCKFCLLAPSLLPCQALQEAPHGGLVYAVLCQLWVWARGQLWLSPSVGHTVTAAPPEVPQQ